MSRGSREHVHVGAMAAAALLCLLALLNPLKAKAAVEQHLFDPTISLTGGCGTDKFDAVPDPWCPGPPAPSAAFENPDIAIDSFGDMYVSSHEEGGTWPGRIDVFSPSGQFITELDVPGARAMAVDPKGNLYVNQVNPEPGGFHQVTLLTPTGTYDPAAGEISYEEPGEVIIEGMEEIPPTPCGEHTAGGLASLAVDPVTEHLFVTVGESCVGEWSSAEEGHHLLDSTIGSETLAGGAAIFVAVDHHNHRLYVSEARQGASGIIQVFELEAPHAHLGTIDGHSTPNGKFLSGFGNITLAVDETSGNLIVSDLVSTPLVYEFGPGLDASEKLLDTYEYPGFKASGFPLQIALDNGAASPNHRTFYIPSPGSELDHTFAFRFSAVGPPEVKAPSATGVSETESVLGAGINPNGGQTSYRIEYTTQSTGFAGATVAAEGTLPSGIATVPVSAPVTGLTPGATYRFRVVAENECEPGRPACRDEAEGGFTTYATPLLGGSCANESLRTGPSAGLPDCRAYELVTPADTGGRTPLGSGTGRYFATLHASPDGNRVSFRIEGGALPGFEAAGSADGDDYLARRGGGGWATELVSPTGAEAPKPSPGGFSLDQEYSFWAENNAGENGEKGFFFNPFIRYPDGHSEPVGRGSLGIDHEVVARLIGPNGSHTLFNGLVQLEPDAPPSGTAAIYDRTPDEVTHVVSLLPGDKTPAAGENAEWVGASLDGAGVAFRLKGSSMLYLRQNNEETYEVGEGLTFAGIAEGGGRIFYLKGGDLFAYDTASKAATRFSSGGDTTPVNVSPDGSTAYFISPDVLITKANPNGAHAEAGEDNLYVSREGQIGFVATVEAEDVEEALGTGFQVGLGQWIKSLLSGEPARETSRTTPDGGGLLFESRAALTAYDPAGHTEVYRYDGAALSCLSCNPTGAAATADASLQSLPGRVRGLKSGALHDRLLNLSADGRRAFFQSYEPLVAADVDGRLDVYEWEAQGTGSCTGAGGCVYLISSPASEGDEDLFAVSESGGDVFFHSSDLLAGGDSDVTTSIYDARVGGGFPEAQAAAPCQGEGCHGELTPAPSLPAPSSPVLGKSGNLSHHRCAKGRRPVRRHGKTRCVKKHHRHHRKATSKGKGSR